MGTVRNLGWAARLAVVLLLCGTGPYLAQPATVRGVDPPTPLASDPQAEERDAASRLEDLYAALRPEGLRTESEETTFERGGSAIHFAYDLVSRSSATAILPCIEYSGT